MASVREIIVNMWLIWIRSVDYCSKQCLYRNGISILEATKSEFYDIRVTFAMELWCGLMDMEALFLSESPGITGLLQSRECSYLDENAFEER